MWIDLAVGLVCLVYALALTVLPGFGGRVAEIVEEISARAVSAAVAFPFALAALARWYAALGALAILVLVSGCGEPVPCASYDACLIEGLPWLALAGLGTLLFAHTWRILR